MVRWIGHRVRTLGGAHTAPVRAPHARSREEPTMRWLKRPATRGAALAVAAVLLMIPAIGHADELFVGSASSVIRWDTTRPGSPSTFVPRLSGGLRAPGGLKFGPDGDLYV